MTTSSDFTVTYRRERKLALTTLGVVLSISVGLQALVWFTDVCHPYEPVDVSKWLLFFPGMLNLIPLFMVFRSFRRKVEFRGEELRFSGMLFRYRVQLTEISELVWKDRDQGSVQVRSGRRRFTIPMYGLTIPDARELVARLRRSIDVHRQVNWHRFLFCICLGQLGPPEDRKAVQSQVHIVSGGSAMPLFLYGFVPPVMFALQHTAPRIRGGYPLVILGIAAAIVVAFHLGLMGLSFFMWSLRSHSIEMLSLNYVSARGEELPFRTGRSEGLPAPTEDRGTA
jgi:hypothetical protein